MKIYISSTFEDLQEHRAAVNLTLQRMGHDIIGMEQYVAEGSRPVARCLADVASADAYVLILAWRYGYVPSGDNPLCRSMTELEFRSAQQVGKPILAFLLNPDIAWKPNAMDSMAVDPAAAAGIGDLRAEVGRDYLVGVFGSPEDLAGQVAAAIARQGLTDQLTQLVLNRTSVSAVDMGGFGTGAAMYDTSLASVKQMVVDAGTDRAIVIDLGTGDQWWSTRLFLLASLLRTLTVVRQLVFRDRDGRFAGMTSPDAIIDGLGAHFPFLSEFSRRVNRAGISQDRDRETDRQIGLWFKLLEKKTPGVPTPEEGAQAHDTLECERGKQVGVRAELLDQWLGERLVTRCVEVREGELTMAQVQQIVDCLLPDVPVQIVPRPVERPVDAVAAGAVPDPLPPPTSTPPQMLVVDRDAFGLELAREWVREGLARNPAR